MTSFEQLYAIATGPGPVMELARQMIGQEQLALLIAKEALRRTSHELSPTRVSETCGISSQAAKNRIDNAALSDFEFCQ